MYIQGEKEGGRAATVKKKKSRLNIYLTYYSFSNQTCPSLFFGGVYVQEKEKKKENSIPLFNYSSCICDH